jgi:hypothetical protein
VIPKVVQTKVTGNGGTTRWDNGHDMGGLVRYLTGPGRANEHENPRLVASSGTLAVEYAGLDMSTWQDGAARELGRILEGSWREAHASRERASQAEARGHVFHVSLSLRADEGVLDDVTWGQIARDYVDEMGFTEASGKAGCEWGAWHHGQSAGGNDHIHVAVCLVREDGTWASDYQSKARSQKIARGLEAKYGLRPLQDSVNDRGIPGVDRAELEKATSAGRAEPERVRLARVVRAAAATARNESEFVAGVLDRGARIRPRFADGGRDKVVGYSVALRPEDGQAEPRWFGGGRLAKDLTLPALRQRWGCSRDEVDQAMPLWRGEAKARHRPPAQRPAQWWELAAADIETANRALAAVDVGNLDAWRIAAADASGVFAEWSLRVEGAKPGALSAASDALARSAQWQRGSTPNMWGGPRLGGQHLQLAARSSSPRSWQGWQAVMKQLDCTTQAIHRAHVARGEAVAAQRVAAAAGQGLAEVRGRMRALDSGRAAASTRTPARPRTQTTNSSREHDLGR